MVFVLMHQDTFPSICHDLSLKLWISGTAELLLCNVYAILHLKPCQSFLLQGGSEAIEKQQELHPAFISNIGIYASTGGNTSQIMHARGSLLACSKESNTSLGRSLPLSLSLSPPRSASPRENAASFTKQSQVCKSLGRQQTDFSVCWPLCDQFT